MRRYEYDFVRVKLRSAFFTGNAQPAGDYQEIIRSRAAEGWRLRQIFTPVVARLGRPKVSELVFEREVGPQA